MKVPEEVKYIIDKLENSGFEAFAVGGIVGKRRASKLSNYYWVIYVNGNEQYKGGSGTPEDPYIIGKQ